MNMFEELMRRGYSTKVSGTWYLKTAAEMTRDAGRPLMLTKEVYPAIARLMKTTPTAVERSMRTSIGKAEPGRTNTEVVRELALGMIHHED
ncbi:MAG: hypothetical protein IJN53_06250 [Oscillospiraceae bacterium]|nr:hypothetical protein [Oscillospiraceae bacterium]